MHQPLTPFGFQVTGAERLAAVDCALMHADVGVGKTLMGTLAASAPPTLVICPSVVVSNWRREVAKIDGRSVQLLRKGTDRIDITADMVVVSFDLMSSAATHHQLASRQWGAVIVDEAHYCKSPTALRTQALWGTGAYRGRGIADMADHVWALTGTPCPNNISELYPLLAGGMPDVIQVNGKVPTLAQFTTRYCRGYQTDYGFKITGNKPEAQDLLAKMGARYIRIRKEDVLAELPPMRIETVVVAGGEAAEKARSLGEEYRAQVQATLDGMPPTDHLASLMRLIEMAKAPAAVELVRETVASGRKVFVVATHRDVIDHLKKELFCPVIHGGTSHTNRDAAIAAFTEGDAQVLVGQIQAAGTGLTLHGNGACQDVVATNLWWTPSTNAQAFARVHRIGQPGSVLVRVLALENSVDELVAEALARKIRMLEEVFNAA